jgi:hypothetical protein
MVCTASACTDGIKMDETGRLGAIQSAIAQDLTTPIGKKWSELQTALIVLGDPTAVEQPVPGGAAATYQPYLNHVIVHSNDFGAVYMPTAFFNKWLSLQTPLAPGEPALYVTMGVPTADYTSRPGYTAVSFEKGEITIDGIGAARVVYGEICKKFSNLRAQLGAPTTDEAPTPASPGDPLPAGRFQKFQFGDVYYTQVGELGSPPPWAASAVLEPIRTAYLGSGGPASFYGPAVEDSSEIIADDDSNDLTPVVVLGNSGRFRNGSIHRDSTTGAVHAITDGVLSAAYCREGGPKGWLGWPINPLRNSPGGKLYVEFQNGVIVQRELLPNQPNVFVGEAFGNLRFHLGEVAGREGCGSDAADLTFTVNVTDGAGNKMVDNLHYGRVDNVSPRPVNADLGTSVMATGTQSITASIQVREFDGTFCGGPEFNDLGNIQFTFDIDNYWGLTTNQQHFFGTTWSTFNIKSTHAYNERDFRGQKWWSFQNFSTPDLGRPLYDRTFADVKPTLNPAELLWHEFFYGFAFKGISGAGNCNGMSLESIYAQKGRSMAPDPIHQLYGDTQDGRKLPPSYVSLTETLNIKQAHQLDLDVILWVADMFWSDLMSDPKAVFAQADWFDTHGDYPVIALWNDHTGGAGHVVRPYWFDRVSRPCLHVGSSPTGCNRIYVADPNIPTANVAPTDVTACEADAAPMDVTTCARPNDRFIEVGDGSGANGFWYQGAGPIYEGGQSGGNGKMFYMPYQLFMDKPVTPFSIALAVEEGFLVILGDTAGTKQISDTQGHTMYYPNQGIPTAWSDFRAPAERVPNVAPLLLADTDGRAQGWVGTGTGATHTYDIQPRGGVTTGTPLTAMFTSGGLSSHFSIPATSAVADRVTLHDINGPTKAISLALPSTGTAKPVTWTVSGGVKERWMELSAMMMSPSQNIRIRAEDAGRKLFVLNNGPTTTAVLRYNDPDRGTGPETLGTITIPGDNSIETPIEPGSAQCLSDSACAAGQYCDAGFCVVRPCNLTDPFGALLPVLPSGVNADGFALSADGFTAYVSNNPSGAPHDLFKATRTSTAQPFGALTSVFPPNSFHERAPWLSADGRRLYYGSSATGSGDLVVSSRASTNDAFGAPQNLGSVNGPSADNDPFLVSGEQQLFFTSSRNGSFDLYSSTMTGSAFGAPVALANVNSPQEDTHPVLTADGLTLFFGSRRLAPSTDTDGDIWVATRTPTSPNFGTPQNLPVFNTSGAEFPVAISRDSCTLYFASNRETGLSGTELYRIYSITRGQPQTMVNVTLNIVGNGSVNTAPFACSTGNVGTCAAQLAAGAAPILWGNRQAYWSGTCAANGSPGLSTDGVLTVTTSATCTITFP